MSQTITLSPSIYSSKLLFINNTKLLIFNGLESFDLSEWPPKQVRTLNGQKNNPPKVNDISSVSNLVYDHVSRRTALQINVVTATDQYSTSSTSKVIITSDLDFPVDLNSSGTHQLKEVEIKYGNYSVFNEGSVIGFIAGRAVRDRTNGSGSPIPVMESEPCSNTFEEPTGLEPPPEKTPTVKNIFDRPKNAVVVLPPFRVANDNIGLTESDSYGLIRGDHLFRFDRQGNTFKFVDVVDEQGTQVLSLLGQQGGIYDLAVSLWTVCMKTSASGESGSLNWHVFGLISEKLYELEWIDEKTIRRKLHLPWMQGLQSIQDLGAKWGILVNQRDPDTHGFRHYIYHPARQTLASIDKAPEVGRIVSTLRNELIGYVSTPATQQTQFKLLLEEKDFENQLKFQPVNELYDPDKVAKDAMFDTYQNRVLSKGEYTPLFSGAFYKEHATPQGSSRAQVAYGILDSQAKPTGYEYSIIAGWENPSLSNNNSSSSNKIPSTLCHLAMKRLEHSGDLADYLGGPVFFRQLNDDPALVRTGTLLEFKHQSRSAKDISLYHYAEGVSSSMSENFNEIAWMGVIVFDPSVDMSQYRTHLANIANEEKIEIDKYFVGTQFTVTSGTLLVTDPTYSKDTALRMGATLENVKTGEWITALNSLPNGRVEQLLAYHPSVAYDPSFTSFWVPSSLFREKLRKNRESDEEGKEETDDNDTLDSIDKVADENGWHQVSGYIGVDGGVAGFFDLEHYYKEEDLPPIAVRKEPKHENESRFNLKIKKDNWSDQSPYDIWMGKISQRQFTTGRHRDLVTLPYGAYSSSGYGDGGYPSFVKLKENEIVAVTLVFIYDV